MIELVRTGGPMMDAMTQSLIFKKYKKTEISLDWTLLKLSFYDL